MLQNSGRAKCQKSLPMFKDNTDKTDLEILQERAEVLGRAGERLSQALRILKTIEEGIENKLQSFAGGGDAIRMGGGDRAFSKEALRDLNREIKRYNDAREYAKLRLYYLIVTREAVGFRRHKTVEEQYPIPPKKKLMKRLAWIDTRNKE